MNVKLLTIAALFFTAVCSSCAWTNNVDTEQIATPLLTTTQKAETSVSTQTITPMTECIHQGVDWKIITPSTCTDNGMSTFECTCGYVKTQSIDATGHVLTEWTDTIPATCTTDGEQIRTCAQCNFTETQIVMAIGHNFTEYTVTTQLTCTQDEVQTRECLNCHIIEEKVTEAQGHQYGGWITTKDATCKKQGERTRTCTTCNKTSTDNTPALGHNYKDGKCTRCFAEDASYFPKTYTDDGVSITIHKLTWGSKNTVCYVADVQLTDYDRFFTACGKNQYGGQSSTSEAAKLQDAVFAVNGCYSAPRLNYTVVRRGIIYNGAERLCGSPGMYNSYTGLFGSASMLGIKGMTVQSAVDNKLLTDTFCFGPECLSNGIAVNSSDTSRAQRTFIGTDGTPGHLIIGVSNGRYSDGVSAGLTYNEMASLLQKFGCTYGIPLDGGGSSTMVFKGQILNQLPSGKERDWIVDFCCISNP